VSTILKQCDKLNNFLRYFTSAILGKVANHPATRKVRPRNRDFKRDLKDHRPDCWVSPPDPQPGQHQGLLGRHATWDRNQQGPEFPLWDKGWTCDHQELDGGLVPRWNGDNLKLLVAHLPTDPPSSGHSRKSPSRNRFG